MLYELLVGYTPFFAEKESHMYRLILENKLEFASKFSKAEKQVIKGLMNNDKMKRFNFSDLRISKFYESFNWDDLYCKKLKPPRKIKTKSPLDTKFFTGRIFSQRHLY